MKFKNPNGKEIGNFATVVGGVVLGAMASRALISAVHTSTGNADAGIAKKESTMLLAKRGGIALVSGYAGSGIEGNDTLSVVAKAACYGMAGMQIVDGVKDVAVKNAKLTTPTTKTQKIAAAALGLGCPSDVVPASNWGMGKARIRRALGVYVPENYGAIEATVVNSY